MAVATRWNVTLLEELKAEIKADYELSNFAGKKRARLLAILDRIEKLQDSPSYEDQLRLVLLVVQAMLHHAKYGGLTPTELKKAFELGLKIVQLQGISPSKSRLAHVYGYLYGAMSQCSLREGLHDQATWLQYLATRHDRTEQKEHAGFQMMILANRQLRMADVSYALVSYREALARGLSVQDQVKAKLLIIRCLRLQAQFELASRDIEVLAQDNLLTDEERLELDWEGASLAYALTTKEGTSSLHKPPKDATGKAAYTARSVLWALAHPSTLVLSKKLMAVRIDRLPSANARNVKNETKIVNGIRDTYDRTLPIERRIEIAGSLLDLIRKTPSLEVEMLSWVGLGRALVRLRLGSTELSDMCFAEYRAKSLRISNGADGDVLRIYGDDK